MNNIIRNVSFPFAIKSNDFKELSLKALKIKKWIDENGQELAEFIYRQQAWLINGEYKSQSLKDLKLVVSKIDYIFREPLELIKNFKDELNFIRKDILNLENNIKNNHDYLKNSVIDIQFQKQNEIVENHKKEQFLEIKSVAKQEQELKIITSNFRKEKLLIKDIEVIGIDNDFLENANQYELKELIKYLIVNEKLVKNTIKAQWDTNTNNKVVGIKGINIEIKGVK
ncbi:hypothetical protein GL982_10470 (plasmid) [Spiroplasma citri]|uniref:Uncharacterized protein n=1 Tax=Spiroplasma citri TaxID=2133 RepID=A0A5B8XHY1_SPICI|nr:hypothetical protein [Spiroplasma citri]QED24607.1 hypothetical protein FRX96_03975 [Spiroplasma citri]QED24674.1 hypothetical protein FRX96_04350 [Spiroplasma citri]QED24859.1 hypothetical protein FRX96_05480 [Spiroplasma citri]QED24986.1 hypothetical protein FRX96_06200 [Spiroplasma citri]QED25045.1 hypothetical protein FRX96_06550 [Spiroplasma citri]